MTMTSWASGYTSSPLWAGRQRRSRGDGSSAGHHAIINFSVLGDQVVITPLFLGSQPVKAPPGKYKGVAVLQQEQRDGLEMVRALTGPQQQKAILNFSKTGNNNLTEAFKDNVVLEYADIQAKDLEGPARKQLRDLAQLYVSNKDDGHARVKMSEVEKYIDDTWFAWIGGSQDNSVFYYGFTAL
jgi:hypothetical protein